MDFLRLVAVVIGSCVVLTISAAVARHSEPPDLRTRLAALVKQGNYKEALEGYRRLVLDRQEDPQRAGSDLEHAIQCLVQLGRGDEIDGLREQFIELHKDTWRFLDAAAGSYLNDPFHFGVIVAGKFHRGPQREGGRYVEIAERDRVRALQLLVQALDSARKDPDRPAAGRFLHAMAGACCPAETAATRGGCKASPRSTRFPTMTNGAAAGVNRGREHLSAGRPACVLPRTGAISSWQRTMASAGGGLWPRPWKRMRAGSTAVASSWRTSCSASSASRRWLNEAGPFRQTATRESSRPYALETLRDDETIACLATGVKRFTLPDYSTRSSSTRQIADEPGTGHGEDGARSTGVHLREPPPARPGRRDARSGARRGTATAAARRPAA